MLILRRLSVVLLALAATGMAIAPATAQAPTHPLDHLSAAEHWTAYTVIRSSGEISDDATFLFATLHEPPKAEVIAWGPGQSFRREAFVHLVDDGTGYEAVVDLLGEELLRFEAVSETSYMFGPSDFGGGSAIKEDERVIAALEARGITDMTMVNCGAGSTAYMGQESERGRRIGRGGCGYAVGSVNGYGEPIEGLTVVVDMETNEVLEVTDTGPLPRMGPVADHHPEAIGPTRDPLPPIVVSQPQGRGFTLDGGQVAWESWRFHFRLDPRRGIVLSRVGHELEGEFRSVLYSAALSELFVPYNAPMEPWSHQAFYDLASYAWAFDGIAGELEPGEDCPAHAHYVDTYVMAADGSPSRIAKAACIFERPGAEPAWRHGGGFIESRARTDLVVRMIMAAGNYDYLFDWIFKQDGSIKVTLAATGMDQVMMVEAENAAVDEGEPDDRYGRFVAPHTVAVNHSHFFNFRLDFDVDGSGNSLAVDRIVTEEQPASNPRRSVWRAETEIPRRELDARRTSTLTAPEQWRVVNPSRIGPQGYPSGYLLEGHGGRLMLSEGDWMRKLAGFTEHTIWVTPHQPDELYAAGPYPTNASEPDGLPVWTRANRDIDNQDIVLWYTIGFHHIARPEDWPILPMELHGFYLKPAAFFERNPSMDLPRR
jgi:primary-amine oxidase